MEHSFAGRFEALEQVLSWSRWNKESRSNQNTALLKWMTTAAAVAEAAAEDSFGERTGGGWMKSNWLSQRKRTDALRKRNTQEAALQSCCSSW